MEECKPLSLSLPPIRRVVDSAKLTDSISQSESLPGSVECLSSASSGGYVKVEPVIDHTDYTGVEPKARLNRSDDTDEGTEWKTAYGMTKQETDRLSNMKEEEEEGGERQSVKMERDDGVKYGEGLGREQEKAREEQQRNSVTDQTCQTHRRQRNGGKSEYGQQEGAELSTLVTACLLKQPRVLICRLKIAGITILVSVSPPPPHPMASKEDWGVKVPHTQHELSTLKGSCSLRQKGQVMTWKRKMIGQLERTQKQLPASSENCICVEASHNPLVISQNTGTSGAAAANCDEGPVCEKEEELHMQPCPAGDPEKRLQAKLKQESEGEPLTPGHPLPGSEEGLEVQCAWSKATRSGKVLEMLRHHGRGSEHRGVWSNARFSPRHFRASRRLSSEKNEGTTSHLEQQQNGRPHGPPDGISTEMLFPLGSRGERAGSAPCEESFDTSAEAESRRRIKGREEFVGMCCGKTFPDALELQTHEEQHDTGSPFGCSDCGKRFPNKGNLKIHQRVHTREKPFVCVQCGKRFSQSSSLKTHQRIHTGEKSHICHECGKSFARLDRLKVHQNVHTGEKPYSCDECGKSFVDLRDLKRHQIVHTGEKPHSCDECGKSFSQLHNLKIHQRVHTREKPFVCVQCGKRFSQSSSLKTHQRIHTGEKSHICHECGKSFADLRNLKKHQRVHTGEKPHSCDKCGKSFANLSNLKKHQSVHTGEKPHSCDECGKSFSQLHNLKTHQRVHTGEKPHSCDECGMSFALLSTLKIHLRVHTREKPHICHECGKSFARLDRLKVHQRVHTGEKPHSCDECGKSFADLCNLKKHQRIHTGEKPHICHKCGKGFARLDYLKSHQRVHNGEKPHSCDECGKSFAHLQTLKTHQRVHTGEKLHSCDECGKSFAYLQSLKLHQSVHTGEKPHSCDECGMSFAHLSRLKAHQIVHTREKPHICHKCGKSFAHLHSFKSHQSVHKARPIYRNTDNICR